MPSFVVTLGGFLIWQGVILNKLEQRGTIIIQDRWINYTDSYIFSPIGGWIIAIADHLALYPLSVLYRSVVARGHDDRKAELLARRHQLGRDRDRRVRHGRDLQPREDHQRPTRACRSRA